MDRLAGLYVRGPGTLLASAGNNINLTAAQVSSGGDVQLTELSEYACAIVFSKDNEVRYSVKSDYFTEKLCIRKGHTLPSKSFSRQKETDPEEWFELDATWWLQERKGSEFPESVYEQTLCQEDGYKVTLLAYD